MSDENANPNPPAPRKRTRKSTQADIAGAAESADAALNADSSGPIPACETVSESRAAGNLPETAVYFPPAFENAIGSMLEGGVAEESAGGDPNSPADSALESALRREQSLVQAIAHSAAHSGDSLKGITGEEYPGERDPMEDPSLAPGSAVIDESAAEPETPSDVPIDPKELERIVEALLFAAMEPITVREMARAADSDSATVRKVLKALKETGERERRPWDLVEVANAFRFVTRVEFHPAIQRLKTQTSQRKLTQAALETLALIAYRQPIGRAEIESVRGVNAGPVLRLLLEKKLIQISGRGTGLGQPLLYGTTDYFLENFGLKDVSELPKPGEFKNA